MRCIHAARRSIITVLAMGLLIVSFQPLTQAQSADLAKQLSVAFRDAIEKVQPAVVSIQAERRTETASMPEVPDWFRQFLPPGMDAQPNQQQRRVEWQGSGVLISPEGEILTNNHVVSYSSRNGESLAARRIEVTLADGSFYEAELLAADPQTDIALIKISSDDPLPYASLGDSDQMEIGDWVLAIGNPFGLSHSVSQGIVSAKGRTDTDVPVGSSSQFQIKDYIQTTAAINPGNSGGPLINLDGEIVGVNNAIQTAGAVAGNIGIGFAIPSNLAKRVVEDLREFGKVNRGYIGVMLNSGGDWQNFYREEYGINYGAMISDVLEDSPAAIGGLEVGDLILRIDGVKVRDSGHLINLVTQRSAGDAVELVVLRKGDELTRTITLAERPDVIEQPASDLILGMDLETLTSEKAEELGYDAELKGVLVTEVAPNSAAAEKNIEVNDVITEVNDKSVSTVSDVEEIINAIKEEMRSEEDEDRPILLKVQRADRSVPFFVAPYMTLNE